MGNCLPYSTAKRDISLVFVGPDGAGKTTSVNGLIGLPLETVAPTCGLNTQSLKEGAYNINIIDLGGAERIRDIWKSYFSEAHGIVFILDSSNEERLEETQDLLETTLNNENVKSKPILILANKQDIENALKENELEARLKIVELQSKTNCTYKIVASAAIKSKPKRKNADKGLLQGLNWMLNEIGAQYEQLDTRVKKDVENRRLVLEQQMKERMERVKKRREERERREMEEESEQKANGDASEEINCNGNSASLQPEEGVAGSDHEQGGDEIKTTPERRRKNSLSSSMRDDMETIPSMKEHNRLMKEQSSGIGELVSDDDVSNHDSVALKELVPSDPIKTSLTESQSGKDKKKRRKKKNKVKPLLDGNGALPALRAPAVLPPLTTTQSVNHAFSMDETTSIYSSYNSHDLTRGSSRLSVHGNDEGALSTATTINQALNAE